MIVPQHLVAQLDRCTVQVHGEDGFAGSGVFAAPGVVLTCAHVVIAAESACSITWQGQTFAAAGVPELFPPPGYGSNDSYPFPDLAVLRLANPPSHPCARLGTEGPPIGSHVYASGFSTRTLTDGTAPDGLLVQVAAQSGEFLRVKHDQIYGGLSGSPVLDVATDRVCGLVKATRDQGDERGGWIIPATAFPRYLQSVLEANRAYQRAGPTWDQLLPPQALPMTLRDLFKAQRKAAEEMPYQLIGAPRVNLADIYVRQQLDQRAKDSDREKDRDTDKDSDSKKHSDRDLSAGPAIRREDTFGSGVVRDLGAVLALHHDLLVTGGPGAGKSTLTLQLAGDLAGAWLDRDASARLVDDYPGFQIPRPLVPLRVSARSLAARRELGWRKALAAAATAELHLGTELTAETISTPVAGASWLIVVDAIDEIVDLSAYRDLLGMLADCVAGQDQVVPHRLLITSRGLADDDVHRLSSAGGAVYMLVPFDEPALRLFAQRWFARDGRADDENLTERFLTQVREARLTEVVSIPLLATVAAIVFEHDPEQLLPARRYQLYQKYLEYLFGGRDQAFVEQWPRLERQLTALPRGTMLAEALRDGRLGLVEQLAVKWVESGCPLADQAAIWMKEKASAAGVPLDLKPLNWAETAITVAMTTGLFIRDGDDIFFLHQSFAEHLAARVYAARLPRPITPNEQDWRDWVDRAAIDGMPSLAHTVLTHYTHADQGEELIARLQRQSVPSYRLVAGELIAYGAASESDAVALFCAAFREWATWLDSDFSGPVFSRSAAALAGLLDHACAASSLMQVATDEVVSAQRRITAAEILANAGHPYTENGVAALRGALTNQHAEARDRVQAADALGGLGPQYHDEAATALRDIIANPRTDAYARQWTASALGRLDPQYHDEAATALRDIIANPRVGAFDRRYAVDALAGLGPQYHDEAVTALRDIIASPRAGAFARRQAASALAGLGPQYHDEAVTALRDIIASPRTDASDRRQAASALAGLGPQYHEQAVTALRRAIASRRTDAYARWQPASALGGLGPQYHDEAVTALRDIIASPRTDASDRQQAANALAGLGPQYHEQAVTALRRAIAGRRTSKQDRWQAAVALGGLGPQYHEQAVTALRRAIASRRTGTYDRQQAAVALGGLGPQYHDEAAAALRRAIASRRITASARVEAADALGGLGPQYHDEAATALRDIIANPRTNDASARRQAASALAGLGPQYHDQAVTALRGAIANPRIRMYYRVEAADALAGLGPQYHDEAAAALRRAIASRRITASARVEAADALAGLGPQYHDEAATALRDIIANPRTGAYARHVADVLAGLGPQYHDEAATALRDIIANPRTGAYDRRHVADALAWLGPQYHDEAATALRDIIANPRTGAYDRQQAANALAGLSSQYHDQAVAALRQAIANPRTGTHDRQQAAESLAELGGTM